MSIVITTEDVSKASDDQLMREASNPTGVLGPAFLVLAEIEKRRMARDRSPKKDMPLTTVQQDIVTGLNALPQAGMSAAGRDVMPQMQPQMMPPQMMPPQMPSQPMADGGLVAFQGGGLAQQLTEVEKRIAAAKAENKTPSYTDLLEAQKLKSMVGVQAVGDRYQKNLSDMAIESALAEPTEPKNRFQGLMQSVGSFLPDPIGDRAKKRAEQIVRDREKKEFYERIGPQGPDPLEIEAEKESFKQIQKATEQGIAARKRKEEELREKKGLREIPKADKDKIGSKLFVPDKEYSNALKELGGFSFSTDEKIKEERDKAAKKYRDDRENPFKVFESAIKDARKERDNIKKNNFNDALINAGAAILQAPGGKNLQWLGKGLGALQKKFEEGRSMLRDANKELRTSQMAKAQAEELRRQGEEAAADKAEARVRAADERRRKIKENNVAKFAGIAQLRLNMIEAETNRIKANTQNLFYKQAVAGIGKSLSVKDAREIAQRLVITDPRNANLSSQAIQDKITEMTNDLVAESQIITNPFGMRGGQGLPSLRTAPQDIDVSNNPDLLNLLRNPVPVASG